MHHPLRVFATRKIVNSHFHLEVLKRLRNRVKRARKEIANTWHLLDDNAPSHTAFFVSEQNAIWQYYPSHNLTPADCFLFLRIKTELKSHHFGTLEAVKEATTRCLKEIPVDAFWGTFSA
ncbi:uncharacterized protein NPIL_568631 [Nephila pilipes]|uniref:Uncharacterized protein n=1 Tax=Nephila pilipes TaxID=299642 RepID=A0A8X6T2J7_NEPPI|nr:uncharacterized protein NPIL_568631 [Nephila pilipes]